MAEEEFYVNGHKCNKRAIALLLYNYGASIDEIAKALHLKPSTVKKYVEKAMRQSAGTQRRINTSPSANSAVGREMSRQPADVQQHTDAAQLTKNQWISLLRSKSQW